MAQMVRVISLKMLSKQDKDYSDVSNVEIKQKKIFNFINRFFKENGEKE